MTLQKKIQKYSDYFKTGTRDDGSTYVYYEDSAPQKLKDAVREAHGDRFPNDWVYETFADLLQRFTEYEINSAKDLEEYKHEIVDSSVDMYTADLIKWLWTDIKNVYYIDEAVQEFGATEGTQILSIAQYIAIDEVMRSVISLLED